MLYLPLFWCCSPMHARFSFLRGPHGFQDLILFPARLSRQEIFGFFFFLLRFRAARARTSACLATEANWFFPPPARPGRGSALVYEREDQSRERGLAATENVVEGRGGVTRT